MAPISWPGKYPKCALPLLIGSIPPYIVSPNYMLYKPWLQFVPKTKVYMVGQPLAQWHPPYPLLKFVTKQSPFNYNLWVIYLDSSYQSSWKTLSFSNSYALTHQKLIWNQLYSSDKMMVHMTKTHIVLCLMIFHSTKSKNDLIFGFGISKQLENTLFQ